ncbi:hypothetical protein [Scytonema sp. PCC 10023]
MPIAPVLVGEPALQEGFPNSQRLALGRGLPALYQDGRDARPTKQSKA